jgi:dienelactone hydrolase
MIRRRALLLGLPATGVAAAAAVFGGVESGLLPGRTRLDRALGLTGLDGVIPDVNPGPVEVGSFRSRYRDDTETGWALVRPPGDHQDLPLVIALHGRGGDHGTILTELGVPQFLAQAVDRGVPAFAVASVDGGETYWHPHDGTDTGATVTDELIPMLTERFDDLDTGRLGFYGWSMGGYGALRLAARLGPRRVHGVAVASPALWVDSSGVSPAGFSTPAEYDTYSVFHDQTDLDGIRVRVDIGRDDPFYVATKQYVAGFPASAHVVSSCPAGAHDAGFWRRMLPAELGFLGRALRGTHA